MKRVGIVYHPRIPEAWTVARDLEGVLREQGASVWLYSAWEEEKARGEIGETDFIVSVGGDGTILRSARIAVPRAVPLLGVNLGRLGFITELNPAEAREKLPAFLAGEGWIDERAMLQAEVIPVGQEKGNAASEPESNYRRAPVHALNEVVVGRGRVSRVVYLKAAIDGEVLTTYKADGVIVATATGSTGYALSAGGPILYPQAKEIVMKPIAAHLTLANAMVLAPTSIIELELSTDHEAMLSVDGQVEVGLNSGDTVRVRLSPHVARFLRQRPPAYFFATLTQRLTSKRDPFLWTGQ